MVDIVELSELREPRSNGLTELASALETTAPVGLPLQKVTGLIGDQGLRMCVLATNCCACFQGDETANINEKWLNGYLQEIGSHLVDTAEGDWGSRLPEGEFETDLVITADEHGSQVL